VGVVVGTTWRTPNYFAEICSGAEAGSYLRLTDACITQRKAQEHPRTCNENQEEEKWKDLIAVSVHDEYSVGPSIRPIRTRRCFTTTSMIQVCSNFHQARACIIRTRPDEIGVDLKAAADKERYVYVER
jgi:hypothetical protein